MRDADLAFEKVQGRTLTVTRGEAGEEPSRSIRCSGNSASTIMAAGGWNRE